MEINKSEVAKTVIGVLVSISHRYVGGKCNSPVPFLSPDQTHLATQLAEMRPSEDSKHLELNTYL